MSLSTVHNLVAESKGLVGGRVGNPTVGFHIGSPAPHILITVTRCVLLEIFALCIADASTGLQPFGDFGRNVGIGHIAVHLVRVERVKALATVVAERKTVLGLAACAFENHIVFLRGSGIVEHKLGQIPVGIAKPLVSYDFVVTHIVFVNIRL